MPRPSQSRQLAILMNGQPVGQWTLRRGNEHTFSYDPSWLATAGARPISLSMPLIPDGESYRGALVESFFDNLLPDSADSAPIPLQHSTCLAKSAGIVSARCKSSLLIRSHSTCAG